MTSYWAEHVWLAHGLAADVRFDVVEGRFAQIQVKSRPRDGDILALPRIKMAPGFRAASVLLAGRLVDSGCGKIVRIWPPNECSKEMRERSRAKVRPLQEGKMHA